MLDLLSLDKYYENEFKKRRDVVNTATLNDIKKSN